MDTYVRDLIRQTHSLCEADSFSKLALWERWSREAAVLEYPALARYPHAHDPHRVSWKDSTRGILREIGEVAGRVITLTLFWARISGKIVCFWACESVLADYAMVREYLHTLFPGRYRTDAMNFKNLVSRLAIEIAPVPAPGTLMRWSRIAAKRPWVLDA